MKHEPRFILRRTTPEQQRLGGQFDFLKTAEPEGRPLEVAGFSFSAPSARRPRSFVIDSYEPIAGLKPISIDTPPQGLAVFRYRIAARDIRLEGL